MWPEPGRVGLESWCPQLWTQLVQWGPWVQLTPRTHNLPDTPEAGREKEVLLDDGLMQPVDLVPGTLGWEAAPPGKRAVCDPSVTRLWP